MVTGYEYFVRVGKVDEPVEEVQDLLLCTVVAEVPAMDEHVSVWKILQKMMPAVGV
jgi:hypothetical protein